MIESSWELLLPHLTETRFSKDAIFRTQIIYPELACRETLINAIAHRDYNIEGRGIEVRVYSDRLEIVSPGGLLSSIKIEDITKIKGLEALTDLKVLNLNQNNISQIKGLESLVNLEELHLDHNQITIVDGLDQLTNLRRLSLFNNQIVQIKSFENKEKLSTLHLGGNPIYARISKTVGEVKPQTVVKYYQMSLEEKDQFREKRKKFEGSSAKSWGLMALITLIFGVAIMFLGLIWGTLLMVSAIIIMVAILKSTPDNPNLDKGEKINLIISTIVSTVILIVIYINFQILWYFG